jgi:type I restriction enzyme, R subunit
LVLSLNMQRLLGVRKSLNEWLKIVIFEMKFCLLKKLEPHSFNSMCDYLNESKQKDSHCIYALGAQTTALIHEHIHVSGINHDMEEMILDAEVIDDLMNKKDPKQAEKVLKILVSRLHKHGNNPIFKRLSERLEAIRDKAEKGLINSIEFIKELCQLAKETLQAEKGVEPETEQKNAKTALTELFLELKTDTTPIIVERIVNDIDEIVRVVRFDGWQNSTVGEREVKRELRKVLWTKYQIKDEELFHRAYDYIKEYY